MRSWLSVVTLAFVVAASTTCGTAEDEVLCEEAVARLERCCPSFDPMRVDCSYHAGCSGFCLGSTCSGSSPTTASRLSIGESRCILAAQCADLVGSDVCGRAQETMVTACP